MHQAAIFDLDGTIADLTHRRPLLDGPKPKWPEFSDLCWADKPHHHVINLCNIIAAHYTVFICTGRMETHREMTEDWLRQHKVRYHSMHMRATGDYRKDEIVKLEMLKHIRGGGYQVEFAVDDRPTVVKMWRANGVPCFVCDDTEWIIAKHATIEAVRKDLMDRSNAGFRKFVKDEKNFDIRMSLEKTYEETLENACALRAAINALPAETK